MNFCCSKRFDGEKIPGFIDQGPTKKTAGPVQKKFKQVIRNRLRFLILLSLIVFVNVEKNFERV